MNDLFNTMRQRCSYFAILSVFFLLSCGPFPQDASDQVCIKDKCFKVEVVQNQNERTRGLQFRDSLDYDKGMLFVFDGSYPHSFWMKDTFISLDIIWMDYARRIVHIEHNVPPCKRDPCPRYTPSQNALYVLEINAGLSNQFEIKAGSTAQFKLNLM